MESKFTNWCLSGPGQMYEFLLGLPGLPRLLGFVGLFTLQLSFLLIAYCMQMMPSF